MWIRIDIIKPFHPAATDLSTSHWGIRPFYSSNYLAFAYQIKRVQREYVFIFPAVSRVIQDHLEITRVT